MFKQWNTFPSRKCATREKQHFKLIFKVRQDFICCPQTQDLRKTTYSMSPNLRLHQNDVYSFFLFVCFQSLSDIFQSRSFLILVDFSQEISSHSVYSNRQCFATEISIIKAWARTDHQKSLPALASDQVTWKGVFQIFKLCLCKLIQCV